MDALLEVLRSSTDNVERKAAAAQLRRVQEEQPLQFLSYTWQGIAAREVPAPLRFFLCTTVISFVEESWHSAVPAAEQMRVLQQFVDLALSEPFASALLARKVGTIVALMARRGVGRAQLGQALPPLVQCVVSRYGAVLEERLGEKSDPQEEEEQRAAGRVHLAQLLLLLHVFLKEMQLKRTGRTFENVCQANVALLARLFPFVMDRLYTTEGPTACTYLLKCALRVFGYGVFDVSFSAYLLGLAWQLASVVGASETGIVDGEASPHVRLLEYALKVLETTLTHFPRELHQLPVTFFIAKDGAGAVSGDAATSVLDTPTAPPSSAGALQQELQRQQQQQQQGQSVTPRPLLALLVGLVEGRVRAGPEGELVTVFTEKMVCRALRICTFVLTAEEGDVHMERVVHFLAQSTQLLPPLVSCLVRDFFADDVSEAARQLWRRAPEQVFDSLDVDLDDDNSLIAGAEQLFLALTGSAHCARPALQAAWHVVNELLAHGTEREVTAALHTLGIGYRTMSMPTDTAQYLAFLQGKLLPVLQLAIDPAAAAAAATADVIAARPSVFIQRRVLWLIGMWCESVHATEVRRAVHTALEAVLGFYTPLVVDINGGTTGWTGQAAAAEAAMVMPCSPGEAVVLVLTALRCAENFVSDAQFALDELTASSVPALLTAVQALLPRLQSPGAVKELAGLVHVLAAKTQGQQVRGEDILALFHPATVACMQLNERALTGAATGDGAEARDGAMEDDDGGDDEGQDAAGISALNMLFQCLVTGVQGCNTDDAIWALYESVVLPCTMPERPLTPYVEDNAWELLCAMAQGGRQTGHPTAQAALAWALHNTERDFALLPTVLRCVHSLLLLLAPQPAEGYITAAQLEAWLRSALDTAVDELRTALTALLMTVARLSGGALRETLLRGCFAAFAACCAAAASGNEREVSYGLSVALVLSVALQCTASPEQTLQALAAAWLQQDTTQAATLLSRLAEQFVLLLDECTTRLTTKAVLRVLQCMLRALPLSTEDATMLRRAIESSCAELTEAATKTSNSHADDVGEDEAARPLAELLLELLGDEDEHVPAPHVVRVTQYFALLDADM